MYPLLLVAICHRLWFFSVFFGEEAMMAKSPQRWSESKAMGDLAWVIDVNTVVWYLLSVKARLEFT